MNILRGSVVGLAGLVGVGVLAWPASAVWAATDDVAYKRDEHSTDLVLAADDDDDDDTNARDTRSNTGNTGTRKSRASNDNTRSNKTGVSRDRDRSRGDKTRDWTRDGGDPTRDRSGGHTNDRSRNDTRG